MATVKTRRSWCRLSSGQLPNPEALPAGPFRLLAMAAVRALAPVLPAAAACTAPAGAASNSENRTGQGTRNGTRMCLLGLSGAGSPVNKAFAGSEPLMRGMEKAPPCNRLYRFERPFGSAADGPSSVVWHWGRVAATCLGSSRPHVWTSLIGALHQLH